MKCPECGDEMTGGGYVSACDLRHCGCHSSLACGECAIAMCDDCLDATGGVCARHQQPECTCYELTGGHQPGCYFNRPNHGQPMNPSGEAVDDASAPYGLAQTTTGSGASPTTGARKPDQPPAPPSQPTRSSR